jgi:SAM-dependent methyltransferase
LWAAELLRAGYQVLGVDYSAAMLKIARQRAPQARFRRASFLEVELPECAAVTALGECFNYLFDPANGQKALAQFLARVQQALCPGGMLIFDVAQPGRGRGPRQKHVVGKDWAVLVDVEEDTSTALLTRHITAFRQVGNLYRRSEEVHRLHLYRGADLVTALRRLGMRARLARRYGSFGLPHGIVGIVAHKGGAAGAKRDP